jgi:hypothetical protein
MLLVGALRQRDRICRHANANHETSGFGEAMGEVLNSNTRNTWTIVSIKRTYM